MTLALFARMVVLFLIHYWYVVASLVGLWLLVTAVQETARARRGARAEALRHARARQRIAAIESSAIRAMREAARRSGENTGGDVVGPWR